MQTQLEAAGLVVRREQADAASWRAPVRRSTPATSPASTRPASSPQPATEVVLFVARTPSTPPSERSSDKPTPTTKAPTSATPTTDHGPHDAAHDLRALHPGVGLVDAHDGGLGSVGDHRLVPSRVPGR